MTKAQKNHIESLMWEKIRRINQYDKYLESMPDEIAEAEESGDTERADNLRLKLQRRIKYRDDRQTEFNGMVEIIHALGYHHRITVNEDGEDTDLTIYKEERS